MSFNATRWAMSQNNIKDSQEKLLLVALAHFLNESTRQCNPSRETLMKTACISNSNTLTKKIKSLEEKGLISVIAGKGCSNNYLLHEESAFTDEAPSRMKHLHTCSTTTFTREAPPPSYMKHEQRIEQRIEQGNNIHTSSEQNSDAGEEEHFALTSPEEDTPKPQDPIVKIANRCPIKKIIDIYHETLPMGTPVRTWKSAKRIKIMKARWEELVEDEKCESEEAALSILRDFFINAIASSNFLTGKIAPRNPNDAPFQISLEWILTEGNWDKIVDGHYVNRKKNTPQNNSYPPRGY